MSLSSAQLDAFFAAVRLGSFTKAAQELHVTQAALTQRIKALEAELGVSLFVRRPRGVAPTEAGSRLLRYCQTREQLEREAVLALRGDLARGELGGAVRIGAYSSVARSIVLPAVAPLLREHNKVRLHLQIAEMRDVPALLLSGEVDLGLVDAPVGHADIESVVLGEEDLVLVESKEHPGPEGVYLDHNPSDPTTTQFLRAQGRERTLIRRSYCDEIYTLMDGVAAGLGRGVVPRHLVVIDDRLRIVPGFQPVKAPVVLAAPREALLGEAARAVVRELKARAAGLLRRSAERAVR